MNEEYIVDVDNLTIRFNMASEKVDNLKEYVIKLIKHELMFQEFPCVKRCQFKSKKRRGMGTDRNKRIRKVNAFKSLLWNFKTIQRFSYYKRDHCTVD